MTDITQDEGFKAFRKNDLSKLEFIPNIKELRDNFTKAVSGTCCRSRRQVVEAQRQIFIKAFNDANQ